MTVFAMDFKDVSSVPADPDGEGKRQHVAETLNIIDEGTSILVNSQVRTDFNAETVLQALVVAFQQTGLPKALRFDRDPRFVGTQANGDLLSPLGRLLAALGVEALVCPPRRPDLNPFIERYHRSYAEECLAVARPTTLEDARTATEGYQQHYTLERPHQGLSCHNQPPRTAYPDLPSLPTLPTAVDPDRWLQRVDGLQVVRKVRADGSLTLDRQLYYVGRAFAGRYVTLRIDATARELVVQHRQRVVKHLALKGLLNASMPFADYLTVLCTQARSARRRRRTLRLA